MEPTLARILLADDDPEYRVAFTEAMDAVGHSVAAFGTVAEALEALRTEAFDIVFLDVIMDGGGAITAIHNVRAHDPDIPVVVITGRSELIDSPLFTKGLRSADAKIAKTSTLAELSEVVRVLTKN
ncbi:response regulator receiver domain protein (CheY-like) [Sagittula stellata E-37]|uniref:Response regulator receiver domain protein (CheY-like) n=1 Tax=Sagittula stellata (strain ATCC 700073 / DSM 11524 / E-37) TaxID=388399 RepID=A3K9A6_SAGS3|nr:response regulator receiver domain protein (CheY-like) [Sagittula stellata E-37]